MEVCPRCGAKFRNSNGLYNHVVKKHEGAFDNVTTLIPQLTCSICGENNNAASNFFEPERPTPGDVSVCAYCGHLQIFAEDLSLRDPTRAEKLEIADRPEILRMQRVVRDIDG